MEFWRKWLRSDHFPAIRSFSRRVAGWFAKGLTGNQATILGMLLCVPMSLFFFFDGLVGGVAFLILALLTDWVDGALARYHQGERTPMTLDEEMQLTLMQRINYRGVTHLGRSLDPFRDKVLFITVLLSLGGRHLEVWLLVGLVSMAVLLTIMRPIKQWLELDHVGSNRFGKYKFYAEIVGMAALVFLPPFVRPSIAAPVINTTMIIALVLAACSFGGHVLTGYMAHRARVSLRARFVPSRSSDSRD